MRGRTAFGAGLRRERERRGITLEAIAEETKVGVSMLEGLERGDISRWPAGIFRRAFVRAYAETVGLDSRRVLTDFLHAFPEEDESQAPPALALVDTDGGEPLRLTLAGDARATRGSYEARLAAAAADAAGVLVLGVAAYVAASPRWAALLIGILAVAWYTGGLLATGRTPGATIVQHLRWPVPKSPPTIDPSTRQVGPEERAVLLDMQAAGRRRPQPAPGVDRDSGRAAGR